MRFSFLKYAGVAALATGDGVRAGPRGHFPIGNHPGAARPAWFHGAALEPHGSATQFDGLSETAGPRDLPGGQAIGPPIRQELKQNREALRAAAKGNQGDTQIQMLANKQGQLLGQLVAIRTEASAKFYQMLTPEQRAKADQMQSQLRQRRHSADRKNG